MRWVLYVSAIAVLAATPAGADQKAPPLLPCPTGATDAACNPSRHDQKDARNAFARGVKLQPTNPDQAYQEFIHAAELVPRNVNYITAREATRQQLISTHIERGNVELESGKQVEALADFRTALKLDPANEFAQERVRDALGDSAPVTAAPPSVVEESPEIRFEPNTNLASFHFRGESRELLSTIAQAYGVSAQVEDSVSSRRVSFDIDNVDFFKAMVAAGPVTKSFWTPLDRKQMVIAADTAENRRQFERLAMRTFYIPGASTAPAALNDVMNLLRSLFDIRFVTPNAPTATLVVRAPQNTLDAATQFLQRLDSSRPQVMLDIRVYQVDSMYTRNLGVHIPNQFNLFNIPAGALAALGGQNIQDLINQLIANGGINQANNTAVSALLAQLQGQQNSVFSQPLATFGGGKTLTGVSFDQLSAQLSLNQSWIQTLDHATLRAVQGTDATFRMGSRYPILNATFAPVFNTAAISSVIQNNSFQAAFPSFTYEDLGLTIKTKPAIRSSEVGLQMEINLRALSGQSINGVPVIGNREYKGTITLTDGESAVVAGEVSHSETRALSGIPGLGQVPGLNKITTTNSKQTDDSELLVVITPHITNRSLGQSSEVYIPK
jgi:type II secretory pathway component GspD/PulD (secretin)